MIKFVYLLLFVASFVGIFTGSARAASVTFDNGTTWNCDQSFAPRVLRYGYYYGFWDDFTNTNNSRWTNYLNTFAVQYKNASYLSAGGAFAWTQNLRNAGFAVGPRQTIRAIQTGNDNWRVVRHPATRTTGSSYDFMIAYRIDYDTSNNYPDASDDKYHVECQPYQVSWCGDGVRDSAYETCDDGLDNGMPGKCNVSCNGTNPPESNVCDQTFTPVVLRYGNSHNFYDLYSNPNNFDHRLRNFSITFDEPYDYNTSSAVPNFDWTASIKAANYIVRANANNVRIIESTNQYTIRAVPPVRGPNNLVIKYRVYTENAAGGGNVVSHLECQPYEISWCGDGIVDTTFGEPCDPAAEPWKSNGTCRVNPTDGSKCELVTPPSCVPGSTTGPRLSPVTITTPGLCPAGQTVGSFTSNTVGTTTNYSWSCNGSQVGGACIASYTPTVPTSFDLSLKKYVNSVVASNDAQTAATAVAITPDTNFTYVIRVTNNGPATANGTTTVTDPGPSPTGVTVTGVSGTGWTCTRTGNNISCNRSTTLASGATFPDIIVSARTPTTAGIFLNTATVANPGDTVPSNNTDPANVRVGTITPLVHIDKRDANPLPNDLDGVVGNDTQTVYIGSGAVFRIRVTNTGSESLTGIVLRDIQAPNCSGAFVPPTTRPPTWSNFTAGSGVTTDAIFAPGEWFEYTCTLANTTAGGYTNSATVTASGAVSGTTVTATDTTIVLTPSAPACGTAARAFTSADTTWGAFTFCASGTPNPISPAFPAIGSSVSWTCNGVAGTQTACTASRSGGGGGGVAVVGAKCVNNLAVCATYNSQIACEQDLAATRLINPNYASTICRSADAPGIQACQTQDVPTLICSGGGGGGGGGCGNGVLEGGEECDVGGGVDWCVNCKLQIDTTPGENPIAELWMTIPTLSRAHLGYTWLDGEDGKIKFEDNRMVLGVGTKAFTLADTVGFGIRPQFMVPLMIEANKEFCLTSGGNSLNSQRICTRIGNDTTGLDTWTRYDGTKYVIFGKGDYQIPNSNGTYTAARADSEYSATLFRGPKIYGVQGGGSLTLNSAFWGKSVGSDGVITISTLDSATHTTDIPLVSLSVRVSGALVGTTNTPVNRSIEGFVNQVGLNEFLSSIRSSTSRSDITTSTSSSSVAPIHVNITTTGNKMATRLEDIPMLNGNQNVRAVKGNLTINCPTGSSVFVMEGVRTILVEGDIIFNCNTAYLSNDSTSSFAWISKSGDIKVSNGVGTLSDGAVTNLAGIYVAIEENGNGGDITHTGNATTQKILKIEGSLYGDATGLFGSRLYARGTSAYEILTTGTIITYSNRALVSPPPLLSQYLNNYNVQRVIK